MLLNQLRFAQFEEWPLMLTKVFYLIPFQLLKIKYMSQVQTVQCQSGH